MSGFVRFLLFIAAIVAGVLMMKYRERMVRIVGKNYYAEKFLGPGGSYTMWVLLGAVLIVGAMVYLL